MNVSTSPKRFIRREVHHPQTPELIYQAAVTLFRERGYHATSIRDIAMAANIQPATIYHYYGNKEALLYTIMERTLLDLLKLQAGVLGRTGDPVAQLRHLWLTTNCGDWAKSSLLRSGPIAISTRRPSELSLKPGCSRGSFLFLISTSRPIP